MPGSESRRHEHLTAESTLDRNDAETLARTLRVVADPTRLQLLSVLVGSPSHEATVGDLAESLRLTQPTVSHHLRILVEDGVVQREQRGKFVWHSIVPERRAAISDILR